MTPTSHVLLSARAVVPVQSYRAGHSARLRAMTDDHRVTRRAVILGAVAVPLAACRPKRRAARTPQPAADQTALDAALTAELALLAAYDARIIPGAPPDDAVAAARAAHADHVRALGGQVASPTGAAGTARAATRDLSRLESRSAKDLRRAATSARSGDGSALVASAPGSHEVFAQFRQVGAG